MKRSSGFVCAAVLGASLTGAACTSGGYRTIALSRDLGPGDVAHFESLARGRGEPPAKIEDYFVGLPFCPVICGSRETTADRGADGRYWYHVEDDDGFLLYLLVGSATVANFGPDGRNRDWTTRQSLLLGAIGTWRGERDVDPGRISSSGFKLLWGLLFHLSNEGERTKWSFLMIPFGG